MNIDYCKWLLGFIKKNKTIVRLFNVPSTWKKKDLSWLLVSKISVYSKLVPQFWGLRWQRISWWTEKYRSIHLMRTKKQRKEWKRMVPMTSYTPQTSSDTLSQTRPHPPQCPNFQFLPQKCIFKHWIYDQILHLWRQNQHEPVASFPRERASGFNLTGPRAIEGILT